MNRLRFLGLRLVRTLATLVIIVFITFAIFSLWPSDPATLACGRPCTPENLERARAFMGYDLPWYTQFWHYLQGIVGGRTFGEGSGAIACASPCLGYSFRLSTPVSELVATRLPVTASIAVGAAVLWLAIGVGAGVVSALRRGSRLDRTIMTGTVLGISSPAYLVGLLGILLFGFTLDMVPVSGYVPFADSPLDWAWHLILPWCVLALISAAVYARMVRGEMLENLGEDYVRTARAVGLPERRVVGRHVMRNISLPVVTYFALDLGGLLGGAVITERVFSMQGLGALLMDAVGTSDVPVVMGVTLVAAAFVVVANLVADAVVLLEAVVPIVLFVMLAGGGGSGRSPGMGITATTAVEMVVVGLGAGALGLILWAGERACLRWAAGGALAVGTLLWWLAPAASALLFAVCVVAMLGCTDGLRVRRTQVGTVRSRRSLVLGELATVRTTQVNTLVMLVVGLLFTYTMARRGLTIPLPMAFVVVNTPLNAYFSRYLSTRTVVMAAPGSRRVLVAYARDLTLLYMTSNCLVGALIVWLGGGLVEVVAAGVVVSLAGASTAVLLEVYRPLTSWKSERDVMRHPRKYLPPAVALLAVMVVHALAP